MLFCELKGAEYAGAPAATLAYEDRLPVAGVEYDRCGAPGEP